MMTQPLEKTHLRLGIVPLVDCAPVVIAHERGFFAEVGLTVEITRDSSWAGIRDKVADGRLDGAHMPAPLPLAMTAAGVPMIAGMALNLGGNTITLARDLWERLDALDPAEAAQRPLPASLLARLIKADRAAGRSPLTFASGYPVSGDTYELRAWLASGGVDADRDIRLVVVPPPQTVAHLSAGNIAGFCVGEPWGTLAARQDLGRVALTGRDIFAGRLEKVFAVTAAWADDHPRTHLAVLEALIGAARWCDENRCETAEILSRPHLLNAPFDAVIAALLGECGLPRELIQFHTWAANFPWRSQAQWYLGRMAKCGQVPPGTDHRALAKTVFRPDLYRTAAARLGLAVPLVDDKTEGEHGAQWTLLRATRPIVMGPDRLLGGQIYDPAREVPAL